MEDHLIYALAIIAAGALFFRGIKPLRTHEQLSALNAHIDTNGRLDRPTRNLIVNALAHGRLYATVLCVVGLGIIVYNLPDPQATAAPTQQELSPTIAPHDLYYRAPTRNVLPDGERRVTIPHPQAIQRDTLPL